MRRRWRRRWCFSSGRPTRRLPPFRANRWQRCARGRCAILVRRTPMSRRWNATRCRATWIFSPPIPTIRWPHECMPLLPPGARRSRGGAPASSTRRPPIGRICGVIRTGRTRPMRTGVWRFLPPPSSRRRRSRPSPMTCRRRRRKKSSTSGGRFSSLTIRYSRSRRRRHRRSFSWRRRRRNLWCSRRHRRRWESSCCRCRSTGRFPSGSDRRLMWRHRRTT